MSALELHSSVKELRELKRMADELAAEITAVEDEIKAYMLSLGIDSVTGDDFKVTWKPVSSTRFDSKAFKGCNPELYKLFTKTTETRRFVVA